MKICICFSGQTRNYKKVIDFINTLKLTFDVKIFSSLWEDDSAYDFLKEVEHTQYEIENFDESFFNLTKYKKNHGEDFPPRSLPMYYKIYKVNLMKSIYEHNYSKFDVVIRSRTDLNFDNFLDNEEIRDILNNKNLIYLRKDTAHAPEYSSMGWVWDQFAFGSSLSMDIYANTFFNIDEHVRHNAELKNNGELGPCFSFNPELMMRRQCEKENILLKESKIRYTIVR